MRKKVKIERLCKEEQLAEIKQAVETKFSFVTSPKKGNKQCHSFAKCRDFLQDSVATEVNKGRVDIYGFTYEQGKNLPVDLKKMRMLVKKPDNHTTKMFRSHMEYGLKLVNHYEKMASWVKSRMSYVDGDSGIVLFTGPVHWMKAPFLVSLYTLLIRLGSKEIKFDSHTSLMKEYSKLIEAYDLKLKKEFNAKKYTITNDNDIKYLRACKDCISLIMNKTYLIINKSISKNYPPVYMYKMHDNGGIFSLCTGRYFDVKTRIAFNKLLKEAGK